VSKRDGTTPVGPAASVLRRRWTGAHRHIVHVLDRIERWSTATTGDLTGAIITRETKS
jgi:hypothetical protein